VKKGVAFAILSQVDKASVPTRTGHRHLGGIIALARVSVARTPGRTTIGALAQRADIIAG